MLRGSSPLIRTIYLKCNKVIYMKQCSVCGEIKDESEFFVRHRNKDGSVNLRSECKSCHSKEEMERYYQKQAFIDSKKNSCEKCGEKRIRCISFHHKNPNEKEFTIGQLLKSNFEVIENEINKCICLCLNCHHEFHYLNNTTGITLDDYLE